MARQRDYKEEYRRYHGKPEHIRECSMRNQARRAMGLEVGDPREVDHVVPLSKGGTNDPANLQLLSRRENRRKGNAMPDERTGETMTMSFNIADAAKDMSDGELAASIRALTDEQTQREHRKRYGGANQRAVEIAEQHRKRHFG